MDANPRAAHLISVGPIIADVKPQIFFEEKRHMAVTELDLLKHAIRLNPELLHAFQIVRRATKEAQFPITTMDSLLALFTDDGGNSCQLEDVSFTKAQARAYFPAVFFPIEDEAAMLSKMYAALLHGTHMHQLTEQLATHKKHMQKAGAQ